MRNEGECFRSLVIMPHNFPYLAFPFFLLCVTIYQNPEACFSLWCPGCGVTLANVRIRYTSKRPDKHQAYHRFSYTALCKLQTLVAQLCVFSFLWVRVPLCLHSTNKEGCPSFSHSHCASEKLRGLSRATLLPDSAAQLWEALNVWGAIGCFHSRNILNFCPVGFEGNLALLDLLLFFSGDLSKCKFGWELTMRLPKFVWLLFCDHIGCASNIFSPVLWKTAAFRHIAAVVTDFVLNLLPMIMFLNGPPCCL